VNVGAKKTPAERDPFDELHRLHALMQFSGLRARSGALLTGIMWSIVVAG
jgi:hypothetical protein